MDRPKHATSRAYGGKRHIQHMLARVKEQNWHPASEQPRYIKHKMPGAFLLNTVTQAGQITYN